MKQLLRRLALRIFSPSLFGQLRFEWMLACVRMHAGKARSEFASQKSLLVNLGAGTNGKPGWVNVDGTRSDGINCVYDCRRGLPFADGSVRGIFTEHFIEHVHPADELPALLLDCHRVLEKGGYLRIIVPDAERYLRAYCEGGWAAIASLRGLDSTRTDPYLGIQYTTPMELINEIFRQGTEHKFAYDAETLALYLTRAGFVDVKHSSYGHSSLPDLAIDMEERAHESLYMEARRP